MTSHQVSAPDLIPNLCSVRAVFVVVIGGELLALLIALLMSASWQALPLHLANASLAVQWVGLCSAALSCLARPQLRHLSAPWQGLLLLAVIVSVAALVTWFGMRVWRGGDPQPFLLARNAAVAALVGLALLRYFALLTRWRQQVRAESDAQFQALQARIRPHFLFNSMNTLAHLTRAAPARAETLTENLAALFRAAMADTTQPHTLDDELALTRRYVAVEEQRLGERLQLGWHIGRISSSTLIPRLVLQPLVENAIYHGIEPSRFAGQIDIRLSTDRNWVTISVSNTLPEAALSAPPRAGNRIAVDNIRQRLDAFFAGEASLSFSQADGRYHARMRFPVTHERL